MGMIHDEDRQGARGLQQRGIVEPVGAWGWASTWREPRSDQDESRSDYRNILEQLHLPRPGTPDGGF